MLDELIKVIECLKKRIKEHREQIQVYESRTRTTLIDPLLRSLGWDISDPSLVTIEPRTDKGWADYALLDDKGKTVVFVEAKKLAEKDVPIQQSVGYAIAENMQGNLYVRYCAFTNGDTWELYDLTMQKPVLKTSIVSDETAKCALQLLGLWQRSMADGLYSEAVQPVVPIQPARDPQPPAPAVATALSPPPVGWTALNGSFHPTGKPAPKSMKLPNGHELVPKSWRDVIIQTAVWLHQTGHLTRGNCQLLSWETANAKGNRYVLSRDGKHPDSTEFLSPYRIGDQIILETHLSSREVIRRTIRMLEHFGQDPSQLLLHLS